MRQLRGSRLRALAGAGLAVWQRFRLRASFLQLRATAAPRVETRVSDLLDSHLEALEMACADGTSDSWSLAPDRETLRWFLRLEHLLLASVENRRDEFAIVSRGRARELLVWSAPGDDRQTALALLCRLVQAAIQDRAQTLSIPVRLFTPEHGSLRAASRALGFVRRGFELTTYVKTASGLGREPAPEGWNSFCAF